MPTHRNMLAQDAHIIHRHLYADEAARLAEASLTDADLYTVALQLSPFSYFVVSGVDGGIPAWAALGTGGLGGTTSAPDYILIRDEKPSGTDGAGTAIAGTWAVRDLNTVASDDAGLCSLAANQITLQSGKYEFQASCPAWQVTHNRMMLYDVTNEIEYLGTGTYSGGAGSPSLSTASGKFTIATPAVFEVRHWCMAGKETDGLGVPARDGKTEIYTVVKFWRVG